jgi:hypothetical protein
VRDNRGYFANQIETFEAIETTVRLPCYQALLGCAKHLSPVVFVVDATPIVFQKVVTLIETQLDRASLAHLIGYI